MKVTLFLILLLVIVACNSEKKENSAEPEKLFNAEKAVKYGADQYGMKKYVMAFLKRGPNRDRDSVQAMELQRAHLKNIERMAEEGKLVLAGPFLDDGETRGIYIFDVPTIDEAKKLTETDPAIKAGSLVMELRPWYGTAALKEIVEIHKTLQKQSVSEN